MKRTAIMREKLEELHTKIYNPKFDLNIVVKELRIEFFQFPLKKQELEIVKSEFSIMLPENKPEEDNCKICFEQLKRGEIMTTIPVCYHQFHLDCLEFWIKTQSNCPSCDSIIRKNMIEHFHGHFNLDCEKRKKAKDLDIVNEISVEMSKSRRITKNLVQKHDINC